jgi:hypothetical protein
MKDSTICPPRALSAVSRPAWSCTLNFDIVSAVTTSSTPSDLSTYLLTSLTPHNRWLTAFLPGVSVVSLLRDHGALNLQLLEQAGKRCTGSTVGLDFGRGVHTRSGAEVKNSEHEGLVVLTTY